MTRVRNDFETALAQGVQNLSLLPLKAIVMHLGSEAGHSAASLHRSLQ
jgi:hypothetical protein